MKLLSNSTKTLEDEYIRDYNKFKKIVNLQKIKNILKYKAS